MPNVYDVGDLVRISAVFTNKDDEPTNPTVTTFKITDPLGNTTTYVYGVGADIVRDSTGHFHVDISVDQVKTWYYRWEGTGALQAAEEARLVGRRSRIA